MSGIGGIFHRDSQPIDPAQLKAISSALSHRGPDGSSHLQSSNIGLIHCMLHDTQESLFETLPNKTCDEKLFITWHGRLDNREELKEHTGWNRILAKTTDSDLILAAYAKWGNDCVQHLLGDFAFAIWDNSAQKLFCARDHMGIKPFYYTLTDTLFAFASEIKGLLVLPIDRGGINEDRIADYLTCIATENESTFYNNILRLPPGHFLEINTGKSLLYKYWEPQPAQISGSSKFAYEEQFYSIFKEATRCRLRSNFPVGSFLSGGIDSSSIVCMSAGPLRHQLPDQMHTFSGIFNEISICDERQFFQSVLNRYEVIPHFICADRINPSVAYDRTIQLEDEPFWAPHIFMGWELMAIAKQQGIRILLDGHDGDSAVSHGLGLFPELLFQGKWFRLLKECYLIGNTPSLKRTLKNLFRVCWNCTLYRASALIPVTFQPNHFVKTLSRLNPSFEKRNSIRSRLLKAETDRPNDGQREYEHHMSVITQPLHPLALEVLERQCIQHGLIGCYPFFDKRLIEFCLALPAEQKRSNGFNRNIVRKSLQSILPNRIAERKSKTNFTPNMTHIFSTTGKAWLQFNVDKTPQQTYFYLNKEELFNIYDSFQREPSKTSLTYLGFLLRSISLSQWLTNQ